MAICLVADRAPAHGPVGRIETGVGTGVGTIRAHLTRLAYLTLGGMRDRAPRHRS
jgi:hypothetical protein